MSGYWHGSKSGIPGYSPLKRGYLNTEKGYYLYGFNTVIHQASRENVRNAKKYAIQLVSRYIGIKPILLKLKPIDENQTISTTTRVYQVKTGAMINGKIYITTQILDLKHITLTFNYRYRVSGYDYFHQSPPKFKNRYIKTKTQQYHTERKLFTHNNRMQNSRRKYKER